MTSKRKKKAEADVMAMATEMPEALTPPATSEAIVEEVVELLEASEASSAPVLDTASETPVSDDSSETNDFDAMLAAVSEDQIASKLAATVSAIDERAKFEHDKDPTNDKIQKTIANARKRLITKPALKVMVVTNVDPGIFNRSVHSGDRYNVYAVGKFADVVQGVAEHDAKIVNAVNLACMRSLFRFRAAGMTFNGEMAKAAVSDKIRIERAIADHLVRHTVSPSTAPTQASSTMQALETLGIVTRSGTGKNPTFALTENPIVGRCKQALAA